MRIIRSVTEESPELDSIRTLFKEYGRELGEDLYFQGFLEEVENPLEKYGSSGGALFLALWNFEAAGCIAFQPLNEEGVCEMKRMYVRPHHRSNGTGKTLVALLMEKAKEMGYSTMRLDTLARLEPALRLYKKFGFHEIPPYYANPIPGVVYLEASLK